MAKLTEIGWKEFEMLFFFDSACHGAYHTFTFRAII